VEEAETLFGRGGMPGQSYFKHILRCHPRLRRVKSVGIESVRAHASTPEASAKFLSAYRFLCRDFNIFRAAQVWKNDESMMSGKERMEKTPVTVLQDDETTDPKFVFPSVQSGAEAASFVATECADGTCLPLFVIFAKSGGRLPFAVEDEGNGKKRRVPLAAYLHAGAEVHRSEKPGFDAPLWQLYAAFAAQRL